MAGHSAFYISFFVYFYLSKLLSGVLGADSSIIYRLLCIRTCKLVWFESNRVTEIQFNFIQTNQQARVPIFMLYDTHRHRYKEIGIMYSIRISFFLHELPILHCYVLILDRKEFCNLPG